MESDSAEPDLDPASVALGGACEMATDYGGFVVSSGADETGVQGSVADGVVPQSVLEEIESEGDCWLYRRNNPYCDPGCEAGETCDFNGECLPYPENQDLGAVTVKGLVQGVEMEPVFPGNTYYDTSLPYPPYESGEVITLEMPGGVYGPLDLYGVGVESLESLDEEWKIEAGVDLEVYWAPPVGDVVRSEVVLTVSVDQHGTTPGSLTCLFEDTGTGQLPAGIVQNLVDSGVTGFPSGHLERRTVDQAEADGGCLDLTISAPVEVDVDVVGYTSCVSDKDCPDGQECNEELQICE